MAKHRLHGDQQVFPGFFYQRVDENDVPAWIKQDARRHLLAVSQNLHLGTVRIVWWKPMYGAEVPSVFIETAREQFPNGVQPEDTQQSRPIYVVDSSGHQQLEYYFHPSPIAGWVRESKTSTINIVAGQDIVARRAGRILLAEVIAHELRHIKQNRDNTIEGFTRAYKWLKEREGTYDDLDDLDHLYACITRDPDQFLYNIQAYREEGEYPFLFEEMHHTRESMSDDLCEQDAEDYGQEYVCDWLMTAWGGAIARDEHRALTLGMQSQQEQQQSMGGSNG